MSQIHPSTINRRITRVRAKINSVKSGYKLMVFRSLRNISAQIIDLKTGNTIHTVVGKSPSEVGTAIAQKAVKSKITTVIFDRGRYRYHGRVKAVADSARQAGLTL